MALKSILKKWLFSVIKRRPVLTVILAYIVVFMVSLPAHKSIWPKYFIEPSRAFDLNIYLGLAEKGYDSWALTAFYPLWPMVLSVLHQFVSDSFFVQASSLLSLGLFFVCLRVMWSLCAMITSTTMANWAVFLFALNPNSVFHGIAYPESLASLLAVWFLWESLRYLSMPRWVILFRVFLACSLMCAARPLMTQMIAAAGIALVFAFMKYRSDESWPGFARAIKLWLPTIVIASIVSYVPYGIFTWHKFGDFFQPFAAQSNWGREFGIHWSLIVAPNSVSSSDNVLTWDLQAFYLPVILVGIFWFRFTKTSNDSSETGARSIAHDYLIMLCLLIAAAHSAIAFFTYPIFMSLGRHVLATPFFFVGAAGVVGRFMSAKKRTWVLPCYLLFSVAYLINFWTRFGKSSWMG